MSLKDISGTKLIKYLQKKGFKITNTEGSHYKLKYTNNKTVIVPKHKAIKIGTLSTIINDIAIAVNKDKTIIKDELMKL